MSITLFNCFLRTVKPYTCWLGYECTHFLHLDSALKHISQLASHFPIAFFFSIFNFCFSSRFIYLSKLLYSNLLNLVRFGLGVFFSMSHIDHITKQIILMMVSDLIILKKKRSRLVLHILDLVQSSICKSWISRPAMLVFLFDYA